MQPVVHAPVAPLPVQAPLPRLRVRDCVGQPSSWFDSVPTVHEPAYWHSLLALHDHVFGAQSQ